MGFLVKLIYAFKEHCKTQYRLIYACPSILRNYPSNFLLELLDPIPRLFSFFQDLEELRQKVRELATRPVLKSEREEAVKDNTEWETELNVAVQKLDHVMHLQECERELQEKSECK